MLSSPISPLTWPLAAGIDAARWAEAALAVWQGSQMNVAELAAARQRRLLALLQRARHASPFYRDLHAGLPLDGRVPLTEFPAVDKRTLMREFDRVSTEPAVRARAIQEFARDPARLGTLFNGAYAVWTSSGTTGEPGWFVHDRAALTIYDALEAQRFRGAGPRSGMALPWLPGERYALVAATGGHFAGVASLERLRRAVPWLAPFVRSHSLLQPVEQLVSQLNAFAPAVLATYPTAAEMLADEQAAGRLRLRLREVWTGGEWLGPVVRARLQQVFDCPVRNSYGASEFLPIAWECPQRRLHVNSDWVILEPVDARGRPVAPGQRSHSVLLTNLANMVQPLIRYDLGDAVTLHTDPCPCGSSFESVAVEGRCDDALMMPLVRGGTAAVVPLALATVLEEKANVHDFQVVQTAPSALTVRLGREEVPAAAAVQRALRAYFRAMGVGKVDVHICGQRPTRDASSGKLRRVIRAVDTPVH